MMGLLQHTISPKGQTGSSILPLRELSTFDGLWPPCWPLNDGDGHVRSPRKILLTCCSRCRVAASLQHHPTPISIPTHSLLLVTVPPIIRFDTISNLHHKEMKLGKFCHVRTCAREYSFRLRLGWCDRSVRCLLL